MGACPTRNGRIRIRLCCHKFRVAFVEAFSGGATSGPSGTHQNGFYSVYIYKTLREWAISSIPDARIKLVCWPPRLPSTQKGAQRSNLIYDRRGEAPTFDLSRRWRRRNHRLRERSRTQAALLLIDYQFFEDEGDCYCNPFRCVCGSAIGVLQSYHGNDAEGRMRHRRAGTSAASARCADASSSGAFALEGAAATGPAASTAAGAHAVPRRLGK